MLKVAHIKEEKVFHCPAPIFEHGVLFDPQPLRKTCHLCQNFLGYQFWERCPVLMLLFRPIAQKSYSSISDTQKSLKTSRKLCLNSENFEKVNMAKHPNTQPPNNLRTNPTTHSPTQ